MVLCLYIFLQYNYTLSHPALPRTATEYKGYVAFPDKTLVAAPHT